ncbi:MAG: MotA/TolQ/ExbB proton channel family protein [Planctomycetota bacterium]
MVFRFVTDGGSFMLPILGASVVGLALILERAFYWLRIAGSRDSSLRRRLLDGETPPPGQTITDPVARVLLEAVRRPDDLGVASARAERIIRESKAYLGFLRLMAGAAALVGMLGTAIAAREAFRTAADATRQGTLLANALHATILGLAVFLAAYVATAFFHSLSSRLARELDDNLDEAARLRRPTTTVS